ncbi:hypothetical protein M422DRAFT_121161, partial [Sphaerobolus stellatus SS14]
MTPFEAAFGSKPDLSRVREWGELVYVRVEGGTKLGGRVRTGRWLGIDDQSKGFRIYWPEKRTVTTERNDWELIQAETDAPSSSNRQIPPPTPSSNNPTPLQSIPAPTTVPPTPISPSPQIPQVPVNPATILDGNRDSDTPEEDIIEVPRRRRTRIPSRRVRDLLEGQGRTSARPSDPRVPVGVPLPQSNETDVFEGEGTSIEMMVVDWVEEYGLALEISDAEALEPRSLTEAKSRADW